jgi:peptidoglycan/xylan/chitin deacetylase (PgdA/CDA1 family)
MQRRSFVKTTILGGLAVSMNHYPAKAKTHIITLSFDDGFKKSFYKTAEIFEKYNLFACLNVIASGHLPEFQAPDGFHNVVRGNFDDWNALKKRGHEIMPHSWDHSHLIKMPLEKAKTDIIRCLDYFEKNLNGFNTSDCVYNFAFNESTPELEQFALTKVRAVRTQGDTAKNPIPNTSKPFRIGCWSYGPDNAEKWVEHQINEFLAGSGGWLVLNLHGLDEEGWGPISSDFLNSLLLRLVKVDFLEMLPAGIVLKRSVN